MDITSLSAIKPGMFSYRIRIRICRTWRAIRYAAEDYSGLHCVMIDKNGTSVLCKGQIIKIGTQGWWYRRCSERGCYRQCFKTEEYDGKYRCKTHGLQSTVPCFRVGVLLGDDVSDVNVTIMGNHAERLFGFKLEALRSKRFYLNEQVIPPEISTVIGQVHVFELKGNTYGEWVAIGVESSEDPVSVTPSVANTATTSSSQILETRLRPPDKDNTTMTSTTLISETESQLLEKVNTTTDSTTLISEMDLQTPQKGDITTAFKSLPSEIELHTPDKVTLQPKRTAKNVSKTLFPDSKKTRREIEASTTSSSSMKDKDKLD